MESQAIFQAETQAKFFSIELPPRKFTESRARDPDAAADLSDCIGKLRNLDGCPSMRVNLRKVKKELPDVDWADGDCTSRLL